MGSDDLDCAYAVNVHRMQGATVDRAHILAEGGGRAHLATSRARMTSHVYVVADDTDRAIEDLGVRVALRSRQR